MKAQRALLLTGSLALGSCGGSGPGVPSAPSSQTPAPQPTRTRAPAFLLVQDGPDQIRSYAIQDAGNLTPRSAVASAPRVQIVADPSGRFLFGFENVTTCCHSPQDVDLLIYNIARDGSLSLSDRSRLDLSDFPFVHAATSDRLYMLTEGTRHAAFHVQPFDGPGEGLFEAEAFEIPAALAVSPSERTLYAMGGGTRRSESYVAIEGYPLGSLGLSERASVVTLPDAYVQLAVHPSGRFLYAATGTLGPWMPPVKEEILIYSADDAGGLIPAGSIAAPSGALTPHPDGRFLYQTRSNEIDFYSVNVSTGALTFIERVKTAAVPPSTSRWTADPSGRFLYATGGGEIWGYAIGTFGSLRFLGSLGTGGGQPVIVTPPAAR